MSPKKKNEDYTEDNQCFHCVPAKCCLYTAIQVHGPRSRADFDDMLWHISHKNVEYFVEDGKWYLMVHARCDHLRKDNRCAIYEERFRICREHSTGNCEYSSGYSFDHHFRTYEELKAFAEARWAKNRRSLKKARNKQ